MSTNQPNSSQFVGSVSEQQKDLFLRRPQYKEWWRHPVLNRRDWSWEDQNNMSHHGEWWQHAVIYQICPQSFNDADDDGIGDLAGIIDKLSYIRSLGVDAIWLCPIFRSPLEDMGYDVTNMREIDPVFGDIQEFDRLLDVAHSFGLKVIIDQIWNHTSEEHPWFKESRASRDNSKADWYVWADAKPDGSPPNNWLSAFMGRSAWQWCPERNQFYFFNFLPSQPELNWHNPDVVEALLERGKFWLDRGVDGFRIDAPNFFLHDPQLRDNPARPEDAKLPDGVDPENPVVRQMFKYNFCRPETIDALKPVRDLLDQYPGVVSLAEVTFCEDTVQLASEYVGDGRFHLAYHSALLDERPMTSEFMKGMMKRMKKHFTAGGDCWMVGNHDYQRLRSRWTGKDEHGHPYPERFYHLMAAMLLSLPGAFCLYQGDELGLPEAEVPNDIPPEEIKDPFGRALYPAIPGRDGSRTPMPWKSDEPNAGFTDSEPWLPVPDNHYERAVDIQNHDPDSLLNTWRRLLEWRKKQPALEAGDFQLLDTESPIFAFIRQYAEQRLLCVFNLSNETVEFDIEPYGDHFYREVTTGLKFPFELKDEVILQLPNYSCFFVDLPLLENKAAAPEFKKKGENGKKDETHEQN
jgi:alpha-glucosidase